MERIRRPALNEGQDVGVFAADAWRLADLGAKHALLLAGTGWMPEPSVRADLTAGRLVSLNLPEARRETYPVLSMHRTHSPPGPAAAWMIQKFVDRAS